MFSRYAYRRYIFSDDVRFMTDKYIEEEATRLVESINEQMADDPSDSTDGKKSAQYGRPDSSDRSEEQMPSGGWLTQWADEYPSEGEGSHSEEDLYQDKSAFRYGAERVGTTGVGTRSDRNERYDDLHDLNEGKRGRTVDYDAHIRRWDRKRITQILCNQLEVSNRQQRLAIGYMLELDLTAFGSQKQIEKVALTVIRHVVDKDRKPSIPNPTELSDDDWKRIEESWMRLSDDERYIDLLDQHDMDLGDVGRIQKRLADQEVIPRSPDQETPFGLPGRDPNLPKPSSIESDESDQKE